MSEPHVSDQLYIAHRDGFLNEMSMAGQQLVCHSLKTFQMQEDAYSIQFEVVCFRQRDKFRIPRQILPEGCMQRVDREKLVMLLGEDMDGLEDYLNTTEFFLVMASCDHGKVKRWLVKLGLACLDQIYGTILHFMITRISCILPGRYHPAFVLSLTTAPM